MAKNFFKNLGKKNTTNKEKVKDPERNNEKTGSKAVEHARQSVEQAANEELYATLGSDSSKLSDLNSDDPEKRQEAEAALKRIGQRILATAQQQGILTKENNAELKSYTKEQVGEILGSLTQQFPEWNNPELGDSQYPYLNGVIGGVLEIYVSL